MLCKVIFSQGRLSLQSKSQHEMRGQGMQSRGETNVRLQGWRTPDEAIFRASSEGVWDVKVKSANGVTTGSTILVEDIIQVHDQCSRLAD